MKLTVPNVVPCRSTFVQRKWPMEHRRGSAPCQPRRACTVLRQFLTTFTRYTQSSSGSFSVDLMFPGIAAQCLSLCNVLHPAFVVLCFPTSGMLSCSNVHLDRGAVH